MEDETQEVVRLTVDVVSAYVANNVVPSDELPDLIAKVSQAFVGAASGSEEPESEPLVPAVSIRSSIKPDHLVCLEDGKKMTMLKRHLRTDHDMTPEEYRAKWNLPADYPMASPNYVAKRAEMAKSIGLGRKGRGGKS
ncbi:MAG: MucR family transcriptional regulator [Minwuia sp.]|uniref:MucR family transcriptional regulator n=1 Tax=Minwuia sp. TaxID=2493630 RepID=UPI003A8C5993